MTTTIARAVGLAAAALALASVAGCRHARSREPELLYAPPAQGHAPLYVGAEPARAHRDLGLVQAFGFGNRSRRTDVLNSLRREAQRMGCDAVANVDVQTGGAQAHAIGVCIRWVGPEARAGHHTAF
ncbi:MAG TPA: hypothetical protein VFS43_36625 [Polyangiaceae bacterium]|nr:hypothetical protein [Polyangiaceae bacterium]